MEESGIHPVGTKVQIEGSLRRAISFCIPELSHVKFAEVLSVGHPMEVKITERVMVKYGEEVTEAEADSMRFVAENTTVPIPRLFGTHTEGGCIFIVMEHLEGSSLNSTWESLDSDTKSSLAMQIKGFVSQLRTHTETYIGTVGHGPCSDAAFRSCTAGPFDSVHAMNEAVLKAFDQVNPSHYTSLLRRTLKTDYRIVFSHGELNPGNIVVHNGRVSGITGWAYSGFYPEYWDFCNALLSADWESDWTTYLDKIFEPYLAEFAVWLQIATVVH